MKLGDFFSAVTGDLEKRFAGRAIVQAISGNTPVGVDLNMASSVVTCWFGGLMYAPERTQDVNMRIVPNDPGKSPIVRIERFTPWNLALTVGVYGVNALENAELTELLISEWGTHPCVGKVGMQLLPRRISDQDNTYTGMYGKVFNYQAWLWLAAKPTEALAVTNLAIEIGQLNGDGSFTLHP